MSKTVILPSCDDGNRGDQALVWQTRLIARAAGLADECAMLTDYVHDSPQSEEAGIRLISPLLRHPGTRFTPKTNIRYGKLLLLVWGMISLGDGLRSLVLLSRGGRRFFSWLLSEEERRTIDEIRSADACFVKGGGFIHTTRSVTDPYRAYFFLYHVLLAHSLRTPVYVMPNSFGPLDGWLYKMIVRKALSSCVLVTARESISQAALRTIGVRADVYPDLAFSLPSNVPDSPHLASTRKQAGAKPIVGITVRPYRFPGANDPAAAYDRYVSEMASFVRWLPSQGFFPVLIEHVVAEGEHESDISAIQRVADELETGGYAVFRDSALDCRQLKAVYAECDFVVGTRFHSVIFALSEGTPAIAIGYGGNKGVGIMKDIGIPEYVVPIEEFTASATIRLFQGFVHDATWESRLLQLQADVQARHRALIDAITAA